MSKIIWCTTCRCEHFEGQCGTEIMNRSKSTCCTCGYQWPTGKNGSHQCDIELLGKVEARDKLISQQALMIAEFEEKLAAYKEAARSIHSEIFCIGGPLNDNVQQYTKKQMFIFSRIIDHLEF